MHLRTVSVNGEKPGHETDAIFPDKKKMSWKEEKRDRDWYWEVERQTEEERQRQRRWERKRKTDRDTRFRDREGVREWLMQTETQDLETG